MKQKEEAMLWVVTCALIYVGVSITSFTIGVVSANERNHGRLKGKVPCLEQPTNFEMLFPAYKLGCWMGAKQGEKYYWSKP